MPGVSRESKKPEKGVGLTLSDLAPGLLVASPSLSSDFFSRTVVLLVEHNESGSFGFVINRASGMDLGEVMHQMKYEVSEDAPTQSSVMVGGPVSPETGWLIYDSTSFQTDAECVEVINGLSVSASVLLLEQVAHGSGPERVALHLGYAGWGPGQLDQEMTDGSWIPIDLEPKFIFDEGIDDRWRNALMSIGIDPARMGRTQGLA